VEAAILQTDGVDNVHDLHVWTITCREAERHVIHAEGVAPLMLYGVARLLHDCLCRHQTISWRLRSSRTTRFISATPVRLVFDQNEAVGSGQ
jgi:Co/Zn/Cd efflux system component